MELLSKSLLIQTGPVDHADWNYNPLLSAISRRRFALVLSLLRHVSARRILEIGFGSGVFMPELKNKCKELYGIDVHQNVADVQKCLSSVGVAASLSRQSAAKTNFEDGYFDVVVAVSSLEFIDRIDDAACEISRILASDGRLVTVMPANSRVLDFAVHALTGADPAQDYAGRRECVLPGLKKLFRVARTKRFPPVYTAYELRKLELC